MEGPFLAAGTWVWVVGKGRVAVEAVVAGDVLAEGHVVELVVRVRLRTDAADWAAAVAVVCRGPVGFGCTSATPVRDPFTHEWTLAHSRLRPDFEDSGLFVNFVLRGGADAPLRGLPFEASGIVVCSLGPGAAAQDDEFWTTEHVLCALRSLPASRSGLVELETPCFLVREGRVVGLRDHKRKRRRLAK